MANLAVYWKPLPMLLLGAPTILVAILMTRLPETAKMDLPQDFEDGAKLNQHVFEHENVDEENNIVRGGKSNAGYDADEGEGSKA